jgi:phage tail-like protein
VTSRRLIYGVVSGLLLATTAIALSWPTSSGAGSSASPGGPPTVTRFALVVDGHEIASFGELVGLSAGFEPSDLEVNLAGQQTKLVVPTRQHPPTVALRRGLTTSIELWDWHEDVLRNGSRGWKNSELVMYDTEGRPVARYFLENAWPAKLEIDTLKAEENEILTETVVIVCEHMRRVSP